MKAKVKEYGHKLWEYDIIYTDNNLCISDDPLKALMEINKFFTIKKGSIGRPQLYTGAKSSKVQLPNQVDA
jgi:hypothetical protein